MREERWNHFTRHEEDRLRERGFRVVRDARGFAVRVERRREYPVTVFEGFRQRGLIDAFCEEAVDEYITARHAFGKHMDAKANILYALKEEFYHQSDGWHVELYKAFLDVIPRRQRSLVDESLVALVHSKQELNRVSGLYLDPVRQMDDWWKAACRLAGQRSKGQREREKGQREREQDEKMLEFINSP